MRKRAAPARLVVGGGVGWVLGWAEHVRRAVGRRAMDMNIDM